MADESRRIEWGRVTGEFLLIFVGVIVALMADDARQDWEQGLATDASTRLLVDDLVRDSTQLQRTLGLGSRSLVATAMLIAATDRSDLPQDSLQWAVDALRAYSPYVPVRATFDLLLQQDGLRHLGDLGLQSDIVRYYEQVQGRVTWFDEVFADQYFTTGTQLGPYTLPGGATTEAVLASSWGDIDRRVTVSWDDLRRDTALMSQIYNRHVSRVLLERTLREAIAANVRLRDALAILVE